MSKTFEVFKEDGRVVIMTIDGRTYPISPKEAKELIADLQAFQGKFYTDEE